MKNIHVIATDKPSRLFKDLNNKINITDIEMKSGNKKNIYITSDEEIKEGDYYITPNNTILKALGLMVINVEDYKKIILTTDQDLISDGVQAIDDEFLEWFIKNPSCEEVFIIPKQEIDYTALLKPVGTTQRQNKNLYSEEELKYILYSLKNYLGFGEEINEKKWFEQFKNK